MMIARTLLKITKDIQLIKNIKNNQLLAIKLFKIFKGRSIPFLYYIFPVKSINYNVRCQNDFSVSYINTRHFGLNSLRYFSSKVWNMAQPER